MQFDVHHFKPYEIEVKVVGNSIVIKVKRDKCPKVNRYIERQFERKYNSKLSIGFRIRNFTSSLSSDLIDRFSIFTIFTKLESHESHDGPGQCRFFVSER